MISKIKCLALGLALLKNRKKALRKYNTRYNTAYYNSIMRRYKFYRRNGLQ